VVAAARIRLEQFYLFWKKLDLLAPQGQPAAPLDTLVESSGLFGAVLDHVDDPEAYRRQLEVEAEQKISKSKRAAAAMPWIDLGSEEYWDENEELNDGQEDVPLENFPSDYVPCELSGPALVWYLHDEARTRQREKKSGASYMRTLRTKW
jgi:hypothetical protein